MTDEEQRSWELTRAQHKHIRRTGLIGGAAGAAAFGGPAYLTLRKLGVKPKWPIVGVSGIKGAALGTAAGTAVGLLTRPKKTQFEELSARLDRLIQFQDPRPRNQLGEFTGQTEGPDPNAMVKTYRQPPAPSHISKSEGIRTAEVAAIGGAAGTAATLGTKAVWDRLKKIKLGKKP